MSAISDYIERERSRQQVAYMRIAAPLGRAELRWFMNGSSSLPQPAQPDATKQFGLIKKSLKDIKAIPFNGEVRRKIENKINRLQRAGATKQALILEAEITTRASLVRLKEWDYKLLPKAEIDKFQQENTMTATRDGLKLHIDPLEAYVGNPETGEAKDRIIPDDVLEKLETAKERELFDSFSVLWAAKVKDPLVLGCIDGCEDYFLVAEWGTDITFAEITRGEKND